MYYNHPVEWVFVKFLFRTRCNDAIDGSLPGFSNYSVVKGG